MEVWLLLIMAIFGIALIISVATKIESIPLLIGIIMFIGPMIISSTDLVHQPTAIDVYKGKTTLEITYRDGLAIDSTVVLKNKK